METLPEKIKPNIQMFCVAGGIFLSAALCVYIALPRGYMTAVEEITAPALAAFAGLFCVGYLFLPRRYDKYIGFIFVIVTGLFLLIAQLEAAFVEENNIEFYQIWIPAFYLMLTFADRRRTRFRWTFVYFGISAITVSAGLIFGIATVYEVDGLLLINALIGQLVVVAVFNILGKVLRQAGAHEAQAKTLALSSERLKVAADMAHMARREAERASAAKSAFVANMSHELRTPLNAIIGFSEILADENMTTVACDRYAEYGLIINKSGKHLLSIVNDILDVAKIEAGRMEIVEEEISLQEIVDSALSISAPEEIIGKRKIITEAINQNHFVHVDPRMMVQVVTNILSNAIKFTEDGNGQIIISSAYTQKGELVLSINDNGRGIDEEKLQTITQPFVQGEDVYTRQGSGTGLGLHLVNMMMELHGGRCALSSEVGKGTTVTIIFPQERVIDNQTTVDIKTQNEPPINTALGHPKLA